jgi:hypothetical protein
MSLHNLNTPNKQWLMYLNTLSSISGDDLTIKPDARRNLLLEVSGNNNIFIKKGDISYNLTNYIAGDASFSNVDISVNLNPLQTNNSRLGLPGKLWGNAYIRDISVTNISVSGNMTISGISNVIQIIPRLANDISSSLGSTTSTTNIWQRAFIRDLSSISTINGTNWPITAGAPGPTGAIGPAGTTTTGSWRDISNLTLTTYHRIYQEISGDISWSAVNGYYGLAKDAYPSLNPLSSGVLAVSTWTGRSQGVPADCFWRDVCWSPQLRLFVAVGDRNPNAYVIYSSNGIHWNSVSVDNNAWFCVEWSPQLGIFVSLAMGGSTNNRLMTSTNGTSWTMRTLPVNNRWMDVCWSPELGIFVATAEGPGTINKVMTSSNGIDWSLQSPSENNSWYGVCWSPQLMLFVAVAGTGTNRVMISNNGINWQPIGLSQGVPQIFWLSICWSPQLGLFVAVAAGWDGGNNNYIMTSQNGRTWTTISNPHNYGGTGGICWSPELRLFVALSYSLGSIVTSPDGITWTTRQNTGGDMVGVCWSPELGIFVVANGVGSNRVMTSSLKGRPPTSYNVFDNSFNGINENGTWDFLNINVTYLNVNNVSVVSDDRLKHNEVVIANGLTIIDKLTPKFYQKTQVLLDTSYNGDLSGYAWSHEAGLIAQEVLQISDLSFVVGGGDYYEQKYNLITQTQDVSANYYEPSANYYEPSANYYELSNNYYDQIANNYEVSYNLIAQAYNLNYNSVFVYGLAAIKELHTKVKAQESTILNQKNIISSLLARIQALEK